ncbi:MAG: hypothetical protein NVS4B8_30130 [Herpetosiphon sp.]
MTNTLTILPGLEDAARTMPFDQFGRYHMLREAVDAARSALHLPRLRVLDVGGFYETPEGPTLPLQTFLPDDDVTVLDVVPCDLPGYIRGDGTGLDFGNDSFDLVVSLDTLEHIPQAQRRTFWRELLRVAHHGVILLAPFGTADVDAAEEMLFAYIKAELNAEHQQLKEHREYGLPILKEWLAYLAEHDVPAQAFPTGFLDAWLGMMLVKHMLLRIDPSNMVQQMVDTFYNHHFFSTERRQPAYRYLIVAQKTDGLVKAVEAVLQPTIGQQSVAKDWATAFLPTVNAVLLRQVGRLLTEEHTLRAVDQAAIADYRRQIGDLERLIAEHRELREADRAEVQAAQQHSRNVEQHILSLQQQVGASERIIAEQEALKAAERQSVTSYRQEISALERILADQHLTVDGLQHEVTRLNRHIIALHDNMQRQSEQYAGTVTDLNERMQWLSGQATELRRQLEAVQNGLVMKLMRRFS